jgi:hypothetical protein
MKPADGAREYYQRSDDQNAAAFSMAIKSGRERTTGGTPPNYEDGEEKAAGVGCDTRLKIVLP